MTTSPVPTNGQLDEQPRDAAFWSGQVTGLKVSNVPSGALNLNVDGKLVNGPLQGFGQMWQKTYRITLSGASLSTKGIIKTWKDHFPDFWPAGNRFYGPLTGIAPGEVALLNLSMPGGITLSTGVLVIYADAVPVQMEIVCVDPRLQWSHAKNIWYNAAMRTAMYKMTKPFRWIRGHKG